MLKNDLTHKISLNLGKKPADHNKTECEIVIPGYFPFNFRVF